MVNKIIFFTNSLTAVYCFTVHSNIVCAYCRKITKFITATRHNTCICVCNICIKPVVINFFLARAIKQIMAE